jgi:hypothetical protein
MFQNEAVRQEGMNAWAMFAFSLCGRRTRNPKRCGEGVIAGVMLLLLVALIVLIGAYVWPLFEAVAQ